MLAQRKIRRRIDDALAIATPLAIAHATETFICSHSQDEVRGFIERSRKRMDRSERAQLQLYLKAEMPDRLLAHRFSAFLRRNPQAVAALDPEAIDTILAAAGYFQRTDVQYEVHRLPARIWALVAIVVALALLPLAAQYAHQSGLVQGLGEPDAVVPLAPPVRHVAARVSVAPRRVARAQHHPLGARPVVAHHPAAIRTHQAVAVRPRHKTKLIAWKFDPHNNPYFNSLRWRHPFVQPQVGGFAARARLSVQSYLQALVAGNVSGALAHLGLPRSSGTAALAELPIISRKSTVSIVASRPRPDGGELVEADILSGGHEYFEVFHVARDGPAVRIVDRYYIPVNRRSELAAKLHS
jgi:hypothetical protein